MEIGPTRLPAIAGGQQTPRRQYGALVLIWALIIISLLAWRTGAYYSGGVDAVVAVKGVLSLAALGLAAFLAADRPIRNDLGAGTFVIVLLYLAVTIFGAWAEGPVLSSLVLAVRVLIVAVTVGLVVAVFDYVDILVTFLGTLAAIGLLLAVSGAPSYLSQGRLGGGILPVNPNQLALMLGPPVIGLLWSIVHGRARPGAKILLLVVLACAVLTGSRTGLIGLLVAGAVVLCTAPTLRLGTVVVALLSVPAGFYLVTLSPWVSSYFSRAGTGKITTLNSRTIAWEAAFTGSRDGWQHWFGGGLAVKTVSVTGTYWDSQVLDSSWVSAFVQGGVIGIVLLGLWTLRVLFRAAVAPRPWRSLLLATGLYVVVRSVLENGLLDAYVLCVMMLLVSILAEASPRTVVSRPVTHTPLSRGPDPSTQRTNRRSLVGL